MPTIHVVGTFPERGPWVYAEPFEQHAEAQGVGSTGRRPAGPRHK
jgi:hypothetical protein